MQCRQQLRGNRSTDQRTCNPHHIHRYRSWQVRHRKACQEEPFHQGFQRNPKAAQHKRNPHRKRRCRFRCYRRHKVIPVQLGRRERPRNPRCQQVFQRKRNRSTRCRSRSTRSSHCKPFPPLRCHSPRQDSRCSLHLVQGRSCLQRKHRMHQRQLFRSLRLHSPCKKRRGSGRSFHLRKRRKHRQRPFRSPRQHSPCSLRQARVLLFHQRKHRRHR